MQDGLGRLLYTAEEGPERLFTGTSTLMHSILRAVGEDLKPPDSGHFVVVPGVNRGYSSSPYLPTVARYGASDDAEVERYLNGMHSHRWEFSLDLSESVRIEEVGGAGDLLSVLAGDLSGLLYTEEQKRALTLPKLTRLSLHIECRGTPYGASRRPKGALKDSGYGPIVVTGRDDSVEDFALFWTLRSELHFAEPFPLWIPIDLLEGAEAPAAVEAALGRVRPSVMEASPRKDDVLIVSASMDTTELRDRLGDRYPEARIGAEDLVGLFTATCEYYYVKEKHPAHFDRGRVSIQPQRPEELKKNLMPQVDYVAYEVDVDGMWLPQSKAMAWHLGWPEFHFRDNASKRGNLRFVEQFNRDFSESGLLDLRTPDGWTLLRSVFEERGYDVFPSDKSKAALGQLFLLGGIENLKVVASSKVRRLLNVLSRRRGEERKGSFIAERKTMAFERFQEEWDKQAGREILSEPDGEGGKRYRERKTLEERPREEWIAIPVPAYDQLSRGLVDVARSTMDATKGLERKHLAREWELRGLLRCSCGYLMKTHTTSPEGRGPYHYYTCHKRRERARKEPCREPSLRIHKMEP
jgi:hypothetical protein